MKKIILFALLIGFLQGLAQKAHQPSSSEIYQKMQKLNVLGNVLYLAAHPDDENTRFISYCAKEKLFNTAYLSLTRGDGGQNLIGSEIGSTLGVIRTQELLAARKIDGGQQFFSRANDFGFSKTADETLQIWDKEQLLSDVVLVIRQLRPDVIVLRFPPDERAGHGHHTASALLGLEAFDVATDKNRFPEHNLAPWQSTRIVVNSGRWWDPNISTQDPGVVGLNIGEYAELLGQSINEISAHSRSQHKSQGFGTTPTRGEEMEYFVHQKGSEAKTDLFEGLNTSWSRVKGSEKTQKLIKTLLTNYNIQQPEASIPQLLKIRESLQSLTDDFWKEKKLAEVNELIKDCAGLFLEAVAANYFAAPSDSVEVTLELVNRSKARVKLVSFAYMEANNTDRVDSVLRSNKAVKLSGRYAIPPHMSTTQAYWLKDAGSLGMYEVKNSAEIGKAESKSALLFLVTLTIEGTTLTYEIPVVFKETDPAKGELYRPFIVTPPILVNFKKPMHLFADKQSQTIDLLLKSTVNNFQGTLQLEVPDGWLLTQKTWPIELIQKEQEQLITLTLSPDATPENGSLKAKIVQGTNTYDQALVDIRYDHIPPQTLFPKAETNLVFVELKKTNRKIGYIEGAGDAVPQSLKTIGYEVELLTESDLTSENLSRFQTIVLGIRAINTLDRIAFMLPKLHEFAKNGGTLVFQYNTNARLKTEDFAPYPLKLSRDRVTEETAAVTFLAPEHPVLNTPNKITQVDFEGWVQERGLYFPNEWSSEYQPILRWHDQGETDKDGALLVARYGKGYFVYTGISFFRELPAGVPGAFRLFVNIISLTN